MAKEIKIDRETGEIFVDGVQVYRGDTTSKPEGPKHTMADSFSAYLGSKEYEGIVAVIQKWYYGSLVKAAWCATSVSFFASKCGVDKQTGKHENVDRMKDYMNVRGALDCTALYGGGAYKPVRGDVVFMSSNHTYKDCTHVGVIDGINHDTGEVVVISGNCDDAIKYKSYNYKTNKYIVAFGAIIY